MGGVRARKMLVSGILSLLGVLYGFQVDHAKRRDIKTLYGINERP